MFKSKSVRGEELREMQRDLAADRLDAERRRSIEREVDLRNRLYFFGALCAEVDAWTL